MKRLIPFFLAFGMLLSLCGCRGSFGSIDLQDAIEIPEDGIIIKSTIEQIKEKNAIAAFYGESNGYQYEWTILKIYFDEKGELQEFYYPLYFPREIIGFISRRNPK